MVKCAARVRSGKVKGSKVQGSRFKGCWVLGTGLASDEDPFLFDEIASTEACGQHSQ